MQNDFSLVPDVVSLSLDSDVKSEITNSVIPEDVPVSNKPSLLFSSTITKKDRTTRTEKYHRRRNTDPAGQKLRFDESGTDGLETWSLPHQTQRKEIKFVGPKDGRYYDRKGAHYCKQGDFVAAMRAYRKALKCFGHLDASATLNVNDDVENLILVATALSNISAIYWKWENLNAAVLYLEEALCFQEEISDRLHPGANESIEMAENLLNLGQIQTIRGNYSAAMAALNRAQSIFKEEWGPFHIQMAHLKSAMGKVFSFLGDFDRVLECHMDALRIKNAILHPQHPSVLCSMMHVADAHHRKGDLRAAELAYWEVADVQKMALLKAIDLKYKQAVSIQVSGTLSILGQIRREIKKQWGESNQAGQIEVANLAIGGQWGTNDW